MTDAQPIATLNMRPAVASTGTVRRLIRGLDLTIGSPASTATAAGFRIAIAFAPLFRGGFEARLPLQPVVSPSTKGHYHGNHATKAIHDA